MVFDNKSQGCVALCLPRDRSFDYNFLLRFLSKNFKTRVTFYNVISNKDDCFQRPVRCGTVQLKDKLDRDPIWRAGTVVTASY